MNTLSEKELTVIDRIGNNSGEQTQRQIAQHTGLSLGLTNLILKRLAKTGYIKTRQLTPKKMHYILTRKGMTEKAKKSYHYIFRTIKEIKKIQDCIRQLLVSEYQSGSRKIGVIGDNELVEIIKISSQDIHGMEILLFDHNLSIEDIKEIDLLIDCKHRDEAIENKANYKTVNLIDHISKTNTASKLI